LGLLRITDRTICGGEDGFAKISGGGCGYLTAFIVTRNQWRDEVIKRGVAGYNWKTGKWEWGEPPIFEDEPGRVRSQTTNPR